MSAARSEKPGRGVDSGPALLPFACGASIPVCLLPVKIEMNPFFKNPAKYQQPSHDAAPPPRLPPWDAQFPAHKDRNTAAHPNKRQNEVLHNVLLPALLTRKAGGPKAALGNKKYYICLLYTSDAADEL